MAGELIRASGLWIKDGKKGKFMSGKVGSEPIPAGVKLFIFKNEKKQGENDPDYTLHFATGDDPPQQRDAEPDDDRDRDRF